MSDFDTDVELLLDAIYSRYRHDFRGYAEASLKRRISYAADRLGCRTISALKERVLHEPSVFRELLAHLTVQVSDMFRDPAFYRAVREKVVPVLRTYPALKVWVAGCSTGEEAYSLAILLREEGLLARSLIYGTDINPESLRKAEAGIYELGRLRKFSDSYREAGGRRSLSEYYTAAYGAAVLDRSLRRNMVFSDHSLVTDDVFAEVQLVSCRNVLIYFNRALQDRAIGLFEASICPSGFLALGAKETISLSNRAAAFTDVARDHRIYQKRVGPRR